MPKPSDIAIHAQAVEMVPLDKLLPYAMNARTHSDAQVRQIAASMWEFGWTNPCLIDGDNTLIAGHGRIMAARRLGLTHAPCIRVTGLSPAQRRALVLADNQLALNAGWNEDVLAAELARLREDDFDLDLVGFDADEVARLLDDSPPDVPDDGAHGSLTERFGEPPFSVLDTRSGRWQARKRAWLRLGIESEVGRSARAYKGQESLNDIQAGQDTTGTSVFDPVLCELVYRWFCPPDGIVLDPFAGGSVRGIVAGKLGRRYVGVDLRREQVMANEEQAVRLFGAGDAMPVWHVGDSRDLPRIAKGTKADLVFSCPPYVDLEVYSDDPADLSTMDYPAFLAAYRQIVAAACKMLRPDRFACFVVGDVRDRRGLYRNFVGDTVAAFIDAGLALYNEAILVNAVGSLPVRTGRQFAATRKLGKLHQNVLVFVKGDPKRATAACGPVEVVMPDEAGEMA